MGCGVSAVEAVLDRGHPRAGALNRRYRERAACDEHERGRATAHHMSLRPTAARPVGEGEAAQLGHMRDRVGAHNQQEEGKAGRVEGPEELRVRSSGDEPDAASQEGNGRAHDKRRNRTQQRSRRPFGAVGGRARVVADHPPAGRAELQCHDGYQRNTHEDVNRESLSQAKHQSRELSDDPGEKQCAEQRSQMPVPLGPAGETGGKAIESSTKEHHDHESGLPA
jgi:hypothetical protein